MDRIKCDPLAGVGLFDPFRVGDASFPFLERGIPSEFILIVSHDHCSCFLFYSDEVCCFDHFLQRAIPSGLIPG